MTMAAEQTPYVSDPAASTPPTRQLFVIWDSDTVPEPVEGTVYIWNGYSETATARSLLGYIDRNGERLRRRYAEWIHDLGESLVSGRTIIDHFALEDGLSYWWMTPFVEQSPWKTPAIVDALRLFALEELIQAANPDVVRVVTSNEAIGQALQPLCRQAGIAFEIQHERGNTRPLLARTLFRSLPHPVQGIATLIKHILDRWPLTAVERGPWTAGDRVFFFASYFIHLDADSCARGQFHSRHWEELPKTIQDAGFQANWVHHYLQSAAVPDKAKALEWIRGFNRSRDREGFHLFVDSFLSAPLVLRVLIRWVRLLFMSRNSARFAPSFEPGASGMTFWPIMRKDWHAALRGSIGILNLLWIELFEALTKSLPPQRAALFLYENQSWERAFIHFWRKYQKGKLIGVSHSTVRFWDLRYFTDRRTAARQGVLPVPRADVIAVNGGVAMEAFYAMDYPASDLVETEALRYMYLSEQLPREGGAISEVRRILVLGDYMAEGTIRMLRMLETAAAMLTIRAEFTVKPHPNFPVNSSDFPSLDLAITNEPLGSIMKKFDVAYASNMTSASVDAYLAGLAVVVALEPTELNFSPLRGQPGVLFAADARELAHLLATAVPSADAVSARKNFFFLEPALPRWKTLLHLDALA